MQNSVNTPNVDLGCRKATILPAAPSKRFLMNQAHAGGRGLLELGLDLIRAEGDVMHTPVRILLQELRNRAFGISPVSSNSM